MRSKLNSSQNSSGGNSAINGTINNTTQSPPGNQSGGVVDTLKQNTKIPDPSSAQGYGAAQQVRNDREGKNQIGGNMADDNTQNGGANDKLEKIEARLKQIAGYRFIPPSIKREREDLEKQKTALLAEQGSATNPAPQTAPFIAPTPVAPPVDIPPPVNMTAAPVDNSKDLQADQPKSAPDLTSPSTDFWDNKPSLNVQAAAPAEQKEKDLPTEQAAASADPGAEKTQSAPATEPDWFKAANGGQKEDGEEIPEMDLDKDFQKLTESASTEAPVATPVAAPTVVEAPVSEEKPIEETKAPGVTSSDLVGADYTVPHGVSVTDAPESEDVEPKEQGLLKERDEDVAEFELKKPKAPVTLDEVSKQIAALTKACRDVLKTEANHEDVDYLTGVVNEFEESVNSMVEKAKGMPMRDAWKAKAVSGRLSTYVKALKADFDFSNLLRGEIEKAINDLIGE